VRAKRCASRFEPRPAITAPSLADTPAHAEYRPALNHDLEQLAAIVVEIEQVAGEDQMAGARHRQEFVSPSTTPSISA